MPARPVAGRAFAEWLMVTLLCAGLAGLATAQGWFWRLDQVFYDAALVSRPAVPDPDVVVVAIDDRSLAEIGRWPWSRAVHAALLERLAAAGARVVALDIILSEPEPDHPLGDEALARAIARHGRVVLPVTHASHAARSDGEAWPLPAFTQAAAGLGHIHIELDPDGIARSVYLWEGMHSPRHPQLALAALKLAAPRRAAAWPNPPDMEAPGWRRAGWTHIPYVGPPGTFRYVSYVDVLRGQLDPPLPRDAIVFVGATAVGMGDSVPTPTSGHARPMPGVEVHATLFSALRQGAAIRLVPDLLAGGVAAALTFALMLVMLRASPRLALLAAFGCGMAIVLGMWAGLVFWRFWFPPVGGLLACMLAYPLWSWRRLEATQHYLDAELTALRRSWAPFATENTQEARESGLDLFAARIALVRDAARRQRELQRFVVDTLESLPVGVVVLGPAGEARLANRRAGQLLAADGLHDLGAALAALPWPAEEPRPGRGDKSPGTARQVECDLPDGRALLVSVAGLYDEEGGGLGSVVGLADITTVRQAQRGREDTMYFLSHDLRAPLAALLTLLEHPPEEAGREGGEALVPRLQRHARTALDLADSLLRLVRAESADPGRFTEQALDPLVQDALDAVWPLAQAKGIHLSSQVPDSEMPALTRGDGDLLERALINLLTNAIQHTPAGGEVVISLAAGPAGWELAVRDTGPGIDPALLPRLFQRFSRLPGRDGWRRQGAGLGLLMVRTVAERHGGSVDVVSRPGGGSVFTLRLPAVQPAGRPDFPGM